MEQHDQHGGAEKSLEERKLWRILHKFSHKDASPTSRRRCPGARAEVRVGFTCPSEPRSGACVNPTAICMHVRRTCADAIEAGSKVQIDAAAVAVLANSLAPAAVKSRAVFFRVPMRFDDAKQEINFLALYHLLDFGSGFDELLRQKSGRDAHEVRAPAAAAGAAAGDDRKRGALGGV